MDVENNDSEEKNEPIEGTVVETKDSSKETKEEKSKFSEEAEKIKNETKDTVNNVKETIKNANFKKNANETSSFVKEMFFDPFTAVKRAANGENILSKVMILMTVFIAANVVYTILFLFKGSIEGFAQNFFSFMLSFLKPIIMIVVPSAIIWLFSGENRKNLTTVISTVVVAYIPIIVNTVLSIIGILITKLSLFINPLSIGLTVVSTILLYFGYKELVGKTEEESMLGKFAMIIIISEFVLALLSEMNIYQ